MEIPEHFKDYRCSEYFASERFTAGYYDESAHFWTFFRVEDLREQPDLEFLAVGSPGCDGIEWGYRKGHPGLWGFYPIEQRFELLAPTLTELFDGWNAGRISV
jgi:hypothetical protein